jgi:hypothetical protein
MPAGRTVRALLKVAMVSAVGLSVFAPAAYGHRLDAATASVLARDIDGDYATTELINEVVRCYRVTIHRVDCLIASGFDQGDESAWVRVVALRGQRLHFGRYGARLRKRDNYTKENTIQRSPPGCLRLRPIWREYRRVDGVYQPRQLVRENLGIGYGKPKRRAIIHKQCRLQRRLRCSNRRDGRARPGPPPPTPSLPPPPPIEEPG